MALATKLSNSKQSTFLLCIAAVSVAFLYGNAMGLKCHSCNGYPGSSSCASSITCPKSKPNQTNPNCYRIFADDKLGGGVAKKVINAGCTDYTCKYGETGKLCHGKKNCSAVCCLTDNCNIITTETNHPSFPRCYRCESNISYEHCDNRSILQVCSRSASPSYCFKIYVKRYTKSGNKTVMKVRYYKGCIPIYYIHYILSCSNFSKFCGNQSSEFCNAQCCQGRGCNKLESNIAITTSIPNTAQLVSGNIAVFLTCALVMLYLLGNYESRTDIMYAHGK